MDYTPIKSQIIIVVKVSFVPSNIKLQIRYLNMHLVQIKH